MNNTNQLFSNMLSAAKQRLLLCDPEKICQSSHVSFYDHLFSFESLGQSITVTYPECQITPTLDPWHQLTILHYLAMADGTPLSGTYITFSQIRDGLIRGGGFDRDTEAKIKHHIGNLSPEILTNRCKELGASIISSPADFCAEFYFMPNYPLRLNLWFADDEFPASGRMLVDSCSEHYLSIEDAVTVGSLILDTLII